jgi:hypothetical protein
MNLLLYADEMEPEEPFKRRIRAISLPAEDYEEENTPFGRRCQMMF